MPRPARAGVAVLAIGFLHTSPVHVATFHALLAQLAPGARDVQVVDEALLADVRHGGFDASIDGRLLARLREVAGHAPDVVVCTCSTLGGRAEDLAGRVTRRASRRGRCSNAASSGFYAHIARHVRSIAGAADVVVLAQASMAPAAALLEDVAIPVLTSPRLAVLRALELAAGA